MRAVFLIWLCLLAPTVLAAQPDPFPQVASAYQVELNNEVIWAKQPDRHLPPASLTKLMTALLVLEHGHADDVVTIHPSATRETGTRLGLKPKQRFQLHDLLAAALIVSANDACHALADHLANDETSFVSLMNRRAQALGMRDTHFTNACGHDAVGHHSSVHDLSLLAHALLAHPALLDLTSHKTLQISALEGQRYVLQNKNALIGRYDGALGLKTGFTPNAGKCLVAYAKRGDATVLLILLHGQDRWWDAVDILDLAFDHARQTP